MTLEKEISQLNQTLIEIRDILKVRTEPVVSVNKIVETVSEVAPSSKSKMVEALEKVKVPEDIKEVVPVQDPFKGVVEEIKEEEPVKTPEPSTAFQDADDFTDYLKTSYQDLGPTKGAKIQDIMVRHGFSNINDITSDKYDDIAKDIEELKNQG
jgi:hypothetical protein